MNIRWDLIFSIIGFIASVSTSVGYVVYNEGRQANSIEILTDKVNDFKEWEKAFYQLDKVSDKHTTEIVELKSTSVANNNRVDNIAQILGQMSSEQRVMEVVIKDLTKAVNSLTENTANLTNVVREVAVLDQRVKHLENIKTR